ncbi:methyltransferase domain-containing protein [Halovulum dunhuangense]|uniref:Small RNA 2'-O-methyltransferase n=1 Tax=Halovulum dunhuangense TaxID=1505036 RepID=A0A849L7U4_9RHOB|nr:methyltransferase domain-containing protein [Halovulum dunhuangense]NNU82101.1 methyltransferase domain-containing protein [Halovulum dunhuangense]
MTSWLHEKRLEAVEAILCRSGAARVLDLGCGDGDLFVRLAEDPRYRELVGVDICRASLDRLRQRLAVDNCRTCRIELRWASMIEPPADLAGFDCAILVETIEHLDPGHMSKLEQAVFHRMRPRMVVITTPNADFNPLLGVPPNRRRHPGHRFEWGRTKFRRWCGRAAEAAGYDVDVDDIAGHHPDLGGASQMAVFRLAGADARARPA